MFISLELLQRMLFLLGAFLVASLAGCQFLPGPAKLEQLKAHREGPYDKVTFTRDAQPETRDLSELRETLSYWSQGGSRGEPRWRGVLVPHPEDLYTRLLQAMESEATEITLTSYKFDAVGRDVLTLVDYTDSAGNLIGWDHVAYPEASLPNGSAPLLTGFANLAWWEYPQMFLDLWVYLAIGLKEFAGEAVKSPFSFVDCGWIGPTAEGRSPVSPVNFKRAALGFAEDWQNGLTALTYRLRVHSRHTPWDLLRDLLGTVPIVGPVFDYKSPPEDEVPPPAVSAIVLVQGIHAGGNAEQFLVAWERATEEARPEAVIIHAPYRYGSFFDTTWSILNISHGRSYDLAAHLIFDQGFGAGDGVELIGFSGGAQRIVAGSRILRPAGITVNKIIGVAGPVSGFSSALESHLLLGTDPIKDPVLLSANAVRILLPLFPTNVRVQWVPGAGGHHIPYFPHPATRAPRAGYIRQLETLVQKR
jgi:hypothetical protein